MFLFNRHRVGMLVSAIVSVLALMIGVMVLDASAAYLLGAFPLLIVLALIFTLLEQRALNRHHRRFVEECHCQEWTQLFEALQCKSYIEKNPALRNAVLLNASAGYLELGQPERALKRLEAVELSEKPAAVYVQHALTYYHNLAATMIRLGDWERAEFALAQEKELLDNPRLPKDLREQLALARGHNLVSMRILRGDANAHDALVMLQTLLNCSVRTLDRVALIALLADTYLALAQPENARACLDYVVKHGGDSIYAVHAAEQLKE